MKKVVYLIIFTLTFGLLTGCGSKGNKEDAVKEEEYVPVEVGKVEKKTIYNEVTFSGKVHPDKDVMVMPKIMGKVESVNFKVGDKVNKGAILFTLDKEDVEKQVQQAKVALDGAKANYEMTKENIENAKSTLERTRKLYEEGAASETQLEQAQLAASDNSLEAAKASVNQAQVAYEQALDALDNIVVDSPITGIISGVNIEEGEYASNAQPSVTIVDTSKVFVQIDVSENIINQLYKDKKVRVSIPSAFSDDIEGYIDTVSPTPDPMTQLYPIKIYMDNKDNKIRSGMFAQVKLDTDIREDILVVKSEAVVNEDDEEVVYVVNEDKAVLKKVEVGLDTGEYIEIKDGLSIEDKVVVKGQNYVEDGIKVKVVRGDK